MSAPSAPGTRVPSTKKLVGVPVMRYLRPKATLRCSALVSQLALGGVMLRSIQSSNALPGFLAHQMCWDLVVESCPRMG